MEILLQIVVAALMAFWAYKVAEKNGRETTPALVLGFLFGIFAVVGYYIAGKKEVPSTPNGGVTSNPTHGGGGGGSLNTFEDKINDGDSINKGRDFDSMQKID